MSGSELILGVLNVLQTCFIAWLTVRAEQTRHEWRQLNGHAGGDQPPPPV